MKHFQTRERSRTKKKSTRLILNENGNRVEIASYEIDKDIIIIEEYYNYFTVRITKRIGADTLQVEILDDSSKSSKLIHTHFVQNGQLFADVACTQTLKKKIPEVGQESLYSFFNTIPNHLSIMNDFLDTISISRAAPNPVVKECANACIGVGGWGNIACNILCAIAVYLGSGRPTADENSEDPPR